MFYVRALDDKYCDDLLERVKNCARGAALATGAELKLDMQGSYQSLITNIPLAKAFKQNMESLGYQFADKDPSKRLGSTDLGDVSHKTPTIHPFLTIGPSDLVAHSTEFAEASKSPKAMETMIDAAKGMSATALDILLRPSLLDKIKSAFTGNQSV